PLRRLRRGRPQPGHPPGHRAAPEVPREDGVLQRDRRPCHLRPGRTLMRRSSLTLLAGLLASGSVLWGAASPAAAADEELRISHVQPSGDDVQILLSVPEGTEVDLDAITVTIGGE